MILLPAAGSGSAGLLASTKMPATYVAGVPVSLMNACVKKMATNKPTLSWSGLSQYVRCGRQYWFQRVARIPTGPPSSALIEGRCGHAALEHYYKLKRDSREPSVEECLKYFNDFWKTATALEDARWDKPLAVQQIAIADAVKEHLTTIAPGIDPMLIEHEFRIELPECSHDLIGILDLVATDYSVHDHKFVARMPKQNDVDDAAHFAFGAYGAQLSCYALARAEGALGERLDNHTDIPLYLNVSIKGRRMSQQFETRRTTAQILWFKRALTDIAHAIVAGAFAPNPINCGFCDHAEICRKDV